MSLTSPQLWVVATPLGNHGDLSQRARDVLSTVDMVLAEDTRRTGLLFQRCEITARRFISLHDHNEEAKTPEILAMLAAGHTAALVSDAGMPLCADPGFRLVKACRDAGIRSLSYLVHLPHSQPLQLAVLHRFLTHLLDFHHVSAVTKNDFLRLLPPCKAPSFSLSAKTVYSTPLKLPMLYLVPVNCVLPENSPKLTRNSFTVALKSTMKYLLNFWVKSLLSLVLRKVHKRAVKLKFLPSLKRNLLMG